MKKYLTLLLPLFLAACPGKNNSSTNTATGVTNGVVNTANGTYVMAGTVTAVSANCGTTIATVTVSSYTGYGTGSQVGSVQVAAGGTFNIPVAAGTYTLSATAGQCQVSRAVQAITNGQTAYSICLGSSCGGSGYYYKAASNDTGSVFNTYPSSGELTLQTAQITLSAKQATALDLTLEPTQGVSIINTIPGVLGNWKGSLSADGSVKVGEATVNTLEYAAQLDSGLLQYDVGYCDTLAGISTKASSYMKQLGYSDKSAQAAATAISDSKAGAKACIYPQSSETVGKAIAYTGTKVTANRIWFVVVGEQDLAKYKAAGDKYTKLAAGPKSDAFKDTKSAVKNRQIASDSEILAEEWGLVLVIQK